MTVVSLRIPDDSAFTIAVRRRVRESLAHLLTRIQWAVFVAVTLVAGFFDPVWWVILGVAAAVESLLVVLVTLVARPGLTISRRQNGILWRRSRKTIATGTGDAQLFVATAPLVPQGKTILIVRNSSTKTSQFFDISTWPPDTLGKVMRFAGIASVARVSDAASLPVDALNDLRGTA